jgi:hypothetical protein
MKTMNALQVPAHAGLLRRAPVPAPRIVCVTQEEAQISLNTVDSVEVFVSDIGSGHWDAVLQTVANLRLPHRKMALLYEQVRAKPGIRRRPPSPPVATRQPSRYRTGVRDTLCRLYSSWPSCVRRTRLARSFARPRQCRS